MEPAIVSHAEGSVGTVLGKLIALLAHEFKKLSGVRDEIQELKDELESMNAFLENLALKEDHDKQVKIWMKQVREIAYDTEDCIDEFMHRVGGPIEGGLFLRYLRTGVRLPRTLKALHEIASNVKSLKTRVHSVCERRSRYAHHVPTPPESCGSIGPSIDHQIPDPKEGEIVGIEDRINKIIWWLVDDELDQRVISIVGYAGLGKTTLAMRAYENPIIKNRFDCRAQISVSRKYNLNVLLRDILKQICQPPEGQKMITLETIENLNGSELISKLKDHLKNKRYVIVIDDIWTESAWDSIKSFFPNNKNGSRIIVTTRIKSVAKSCSFPYLDCVYQMERLGETESKNLFFTKIFGHPNGCPSKLEVVSNNILKKCGGMPLAIVSIAGLLYVKPNKTDEPEWQKVHQSLGSELESNPSLEGMRKILNRSYSDLPYHLKTCFLYMSIFPEDHTIRREKLVRRWVAEGFVGGKRGLSQEQVGESYFDEFVNRNLIQAVHCSSDGRVQTCRVHDMILELMIAKSMEDNFVSVVRDQYTVAPRDKIRRLSVHSLEKNFINHGLCHTRSLSVFKHANTICKLISLSNFKVVRVLDLENCGITDYHLKYVGNLFLLKYLGLRGNSQLKNLPTQICKLQNLEMVDIKDTNITKLPKRISNLPNLKHLVASNGMDGPRCEISLLNLENMRNLETLTGVSFGKKTSKSLEHLKNLKELSFIVGRHRKDELLDLQLSPNLTSLKLYCDAGSIPKCIDSLQYLVKLSLAGLILTNTDMQSIGKLPKLLALKLSMLRFPPGEKKKIIFRENLFKNIKLLCINYCEICVDVIFAKASARKLEKITWNFSPEHNGNGMERIIGIKHLLKLNEIHVSHFQRPSIIDKMEEAADAHPNHPKITITEWSRT